MMTSWMRKVSGISLALAAMACFAESAASADLGGRDEAPLIEPVRAKSPWTFSFTTYGWLSWISGDLTVRGRSFSVQATPIDVINALDWSQIPIWMSYAEARNGRLGLFNDIVYAKLAGSADFATAGPAGSVTLDGKADSDYQQATIELGAAYAIWDNGRAESAGGTALDLLAGGRYWHQKVNVAANFVLGGLPILPGSGLAVARSGSVDWVDPFIGARVRHKIAPGHEITVRGDVGGFGVGSDFSWHVLAAYNFQLCATDRYVLDGYIGYKALSVDYSQGSGASKYEYDVLQQGPVVGTTLRF